MTALWREIKKIFRQLRGAENIFGYHSTVANQLFLMYCFSGKIYFTDKIHQRVKHLWYGLVTVQIVLAYVMGVDYLWNGSRTDLVMLLNVFTVFGSLQLGAIGFPLILHFFGDRIEPMIEQVDNILNTKADSAGFKQQKIKADARKYLAMFLIPFLVCLLTYLLVSILDMMLFFEPDKGANYLYYPIPPPLIRIFGSNFGWVIAAECFTTVMFLFLAVEACMICSLILYSGIVCCNQLNSIGSYLNAVSSDLNMRTEEGQCLADWNTIFDCALQHSIKEFQTATSMINDFRRFIEAHGTITVIGTFCYGVALLYVCYSGDLSFVLKVKCSMGFIGVGISIFLLYWVGQSLNDSVSEVSLAVYSTPWYQSVKVRKTTYIFLCQTQSMKNFAIFKVYGLQLNNFSRYLNGIVSYTNILLKFTGK